jgi:hypothetical protein
VQVCSGSLAEFGAGSHTKTYRKMDSAWNRSLRQAKQSSAVKEYPAVRSATMKTDSTAELNLSCGSLEYSPGSIRYLERERLVCFHVRFLWLQLGNIPSQDHP